MVADFCDSFGFCAGMDSGVFTENVVISDFDITYRSGNYAVILSRLSDCTEGMKNVIAADGGVTVDVAMADKSAAGTDFDIGTDIAQRTDFHVFCDLSTGGYY
jgi:hypothetical protein